MPLMTVNISQKIYSIIQDLVTQDRYATPEQFLEVAAFNQIALERGSRPVDLIDSLRSIGVHANSQGNATRRTQPVARRSNDKTESASEWMLAAHRRLSMDGLRGTLPKSAETTARPQEERVWGQVNRFFPLKVAVRWLAVAAAQRHAWSAFRESSDPLADDAAAVGSYCSHLDSLTERTRDDRLSTSLPQRGNAASRDRFLSQYIARSTRGGDIYPGAICQYALAVFEEDQLALTASGLELAQIENPVLDHLTGPPPHSALSVEERAFFSRQILRLVPGEQRDFRVVLRIMQAGMVTPAELLSAVRTEFPSDWTDLVARTHVSGIIARMVDVGLVRRVWEGRKVRYEVKELDTFWSNSIPIAPSESSIG
jgi:hypothetical protein